MYQNVSPPRLESEEVSAASCLKQGGKRNQLQKTNCGI